MAQDLRLKTSTYFNKFLGGRGPFVTFTFDDFHRSALTIGGAILEECGGRGTYYTAMGLLGGHDDYGEYFRSSDLRSLVDRGHELANHTYSHVAAGDVSLKNFLIEIEQCDAALREDLKSGVSNNFAFPYGSATLTAKRKVGERMDSCRSACAGLNGPFVDLNWLRANCLYGGREQFDAAKRLIQKNEQQQTWLIFCTHDVAHNPSKFGCTPELLHEVATEAASRSVGIKTVRDVVAEICKTR